MITDTVLSRASILPGDFSGQPIMPKIVAQSEIGPRKS
jgi:hypothetical protein